MPLALLLEGGSAVDAGGLAAVLAPLATRAAAPLLVAQPAQLPLSLRSALGQLAVPPAQALAVSLSTAVPGGLLAAAAAARCAALHAPPQLDPAALALVVLQRFAALMRAVRRCLVCGYVMKRSRQLSLCAEGMLPLVPTAGLCFMPLDPALPLEAQPPFDLLLKKPTDYLE